MKINIKLLVLLCLANFTLNAQEYKLENVGRNVNSADGDNDPIISPDGKTLYFWSTRGGATSFYSEMDSLGVFGRAKALEEPFKSIRAKVCAISPDGNKLLVNYYKNNCSTFAFSNKTATGWGPIEDLIIEEYPTKTDDNYFTRASLSNDGNTIVMVYTDALNKTSKYRTELVVIFRKEDNTWTKPLNLGPTINHNESEISPFLASDNKTLYFSRNTESNSNDFDIFKTTRLDNTWTNWSEPIKLGSNVNDERWNSDYVIPASGNYAYLVSSKNPLAGIYTDIFRIRLRDDEKPSPVVLISGIVINQKTKEAIEANIHYENLETGEIIGTARTNPSTGEYTIILPYGVNYGMTALADNFISISDNINLLETAAYQELTKNLSLIPIEVGETILLNNLFFETGKSTLKSESFSELNRLVSILNKNPSLKIQINGHTDSDGSLELNKKLSLDRATSVKTYLISKNIAANRISSKGFGPSKPVADNSTEEGKRLNRRVEFEILVK